MAELTVDELTTATVDGTGVFDLLMKATKAHLQEEYSKNRIRGPEYSTVYLSGLQSAMDQGIRFLLERHNAALIEAQIALAEKQLLQADKELLLADKALLKADKDIELAQAQIEKMEFDRDLTEQQILNMQAEALNIPKQGLLLDQQVLNMIQEVARTQAQVDQIEAELLNVPKQGLMIDAQRQVQEQQKVNLVSEELRIDQQTAQITAEIVNIPKQGLVLEAQECKLKGEFDLSVVQKVRVANESDLIVQKKITESAQTNGAIADPTSAIGRQNTVLERQADGFHRLAEQRAAEIITDLWTVGMGTDITIKAEQIITKGEAGGIIDNLRTGADY